MLFLLISFKLLEHFCFPLCTRILNCLSLCTNYKGPLSKPKIHIMPLYALYF